VLERHCLKLKLDTAFTTRLAFYLIDAAHQRSWAIRGFDKT